MKKIILFLASTPSSGGNFQYDQTILKAILALPKEKFDITIIYTDKIWGNYIDNNIKKIGVSFDCFTKRLLQFLIVCEFPLNLIRNYFKKINAIAKIIIQENPALCIFPSQETFWSYVVDVPSLSAIHDLMHKYEKQFPEVSGDGRYRYREKHFSSICKYSKGILVDSNYGKKQLAESYSVISDKIFVLPYIAPEHILKQGSSFDLKYKLPPKYIFYPAQFWQHKNHIRLIQAINLIKKDIPDIQLVLVGSKKNAYQDVAGLVEKLSLKQNVHFMGYIPDEDLSEFYKRARALIMPTFFGPTNIPPLEAFAIGCPVGISNAYGMPDQVGDAGLTFDPKSVTEITNVIKRLWTDDVLCAELIKRGKIKHQNWGQAEFNKRVLEIIEQLTL